MPPAGTPGVTALTERTRPGGDTGPGRPGAVTAALLVASLLLIGLNLRAAVAGVGPMLRDITAGLALSPEAASAFASIPVVLFGLASPVTPAIARRFGTEGTVMAALVLLAGGTALRASGSVLPLFAGQIAAMFGIGVLNVLMPGLVKRDFPQRIALMTGLYTTAFCLGGAVAAGLSVPIAAAFGGSWRAALAAFSVPAALAALLWAIRLMFGARHADNRVARVGGIWRDRLAWQILLYMGLQSALAYIVFGWLPAMLRDRGLPAVGAGLVLSVSAVAQGVACLIAPAIAMRGRDQRAVIVASVALCAVGLLGCFVLPLGQIWVWSVVLGLSQGALIALALTIIVLRSPDAPTTASLSGMVQCGGYLLAALGPLLAGLMRNATGSWTAVLAFSLAVCAGAAVFGYAAGRDRVVGVSAAARR